MKGKYLYMPDGSMSSIFRDREDIVFSIGQSNISRVLILEKMYIRGDIKNKRCK